MAIEDVQTNLRIPSNLKEQLQASADAAGRSLSAEAAFRLGQAYELERSLDEMVGNVRAAREGVEMARHEIERLQSANQALAQTVAILEERLKTVNAARESDIAAATRHYEDRITHFVEKLKLAESRAETASADLAPTVARLERDVARLEVDKAAETLTIRVIASTLRPLLSELPGDRVLDGILENTTVEDWKGLCDAYLKTKVVRRTDLDAAYDRLQKAEATVRDLMPAEADPIWERMQQLKRDAAIPVEAVSKKRPMTLRRNLKKP